MEQRVGGYPPPDSVPEMANAMLGFVRGRSDPNLLEITLLLFSDDLAGVSGETPLRAIEDL